MSVKRNVYEYTNLISKEINAFLDDYNSKSLEFGEFDPVEENYKLEAIRDFRKFGCRISEDKQTNGKIKVTITKMKLSKYRFG